MILRVSLSLLFLLAGTVLGQGKPKADYLAAGKRAAWPQTTSPGSQAGATGQQQNSAAAPAAPGLVSIFLFESSASACKPQEVR